MNELAIVFIVLNLALIGIIAWQAHKLDHTHAEMESVIDGVTEIIEVVNTNADVQKKLAEVTRQTTMKIDFILPVLDAHSHALKVYKPLLDSLDEPITREIED